MDSDVLFSRMGAGLNESESAAGVRVRVVPQHRSGDSPVEEKRKSRKRALPWILVGLLLLALLGALATWWLLRPAETNEGGGVSWAQGQSSESGTPLQPGSVRVAGYPKVKLADGIVAHVPIKNPSENTFALSYILDLDGETLWESGLIKPGVEVGEQRLSRALSPGVHKATWLVQAWTLDEKDPQGLNKVEMPCEITVAE
jgi:hypothetical protein